MRGSSYHLPLLLSLVLCLAPERAFATNRTVTNLNDSGAGSLRDAINASANGDTIDFDPSVTGTISLTTGRLQISHSISILGPGYNLLTIQRDSSATFPFRIFEINNNTTTGPTVSISGLTIANGQQSGTSGSGTGGGIYSAYAALSLNGCVITGNSASDTNNPGLSGGGGVYAFGGSAGGSLSMTNCTIGSNSAAQGGGVYVNFSNSTATFTNCTFSGNSTNPTSSTGAGIYGTSPITVNGCTFISNSTAGSGGAIYLVSAGSSSVQNSTFFSNSANHGGGIFNGAQLTVLSCTFSESQLYNSGGAAQSLTIGNTILQSFNSINLATAGVIITSQGYNLDSGADIYLTGPGDITNTDPKLDFVPQDNGGFTKTLALTAGSPAIDQGKSFGLTTDQRGVARPFDNPNIPNASGGDGSDIGAYEAPIDAVQKGPTYTVNTLADHDDGTCGGADCTLREAILRANGLVNSIKTVAFSVTGTITINTTPYEFSINTSNGPMTITGPGARSLAISGGSAHRIFNVNAGNSFVTISGLTIRDGNYAPPQNQGETRQGGAVLNSGNLTFTDCAFVNNSVTGATNINNGGDGGGGQGGALFNQAALTLNRCTLNGNVAAGAAGATFTSSTIIRSGGNGGVGQGGGVFNNTGASLTIQNSTFNGNSASGGAGGNGNSPGLLASGGNANGGAIYNLGGLTITSGTISGNTGTGGVGASSGNIHGPRGSGNGGLSDASGSNGHLANTIAAANAGNTAPDAEGTFASSGYNLIGIGDQSSGFTTTGDQTGTTAAPINPQLSPLQNNGGPTDTMTPVGFSPAIDQGKSFGFTIDQRSQSRPYDEPSIPSATGGDGSDIGAVETQAQLGPTFLVTTAADHDDGACTPADCTLREAINAANETTGANTITFAANVTGSITLSLGTLNVNDSTTIIGPGARVLSINGNATYRILYFSAGTSTISGLTITNGSVVGPPASMVTAAAAIFNQGTLTVSDCTLSSNQARGSDGPNGFDGGTVEGGAVANSGTLTLNRCTLSGNSATGGRGGDNFQPFAHAGRGGSGEGGAVLNYGGATLLINNCTFNGNGATGGAGGNGYFGGNGGSGSGAAVFNLGTMTVTAATISGNTGTGSTGGTSSSGPPGMPGSGSGGIVAAGGSSAVGDTISAGNNANNGGGKDVNGTFTSNGYNLFGSGDHSTGFTNGSNHDQVGTDAALINAQLGGLQNNGGSTNTLALQSTSPAINKGDPNATSQDQRYYLRSGTPDVGAFEFQGTLAPVSAVSSKTHGGAGTLNLTLPLTGTAAIECRSGGATNDHQLVLTFPATVTVNGTPQAQVTTGTGQIGTKGSSNGGIVSVTGGVVTIPLTNVTNAQRIAVTLFNVSDGTNSNNVVVSMGVLIGDTNADAFVDAIDTAQTKSKSGQAVNTTNFREDINTDGFLDAIDVAFVKSKSGTVLPGPMALPSDEPAQTLPNRRSRERSSSISPK